MTFIQVKISLYFLLISTVAINSCIQTPGISNKLKLDSRYNQIQEIVAIADCDGPFGKYITEVRSSRNGECYFKQEFEQDPRPFIVRINSNHQGFMLDDQEAVVDTLRMEDVLMIRGHENHFMHALPHLRFEEINFEKKIRQEGQDFDLYLGKDLLNQNVKFYYLADSNRIEKLEFINPVDTTQLIEVIHKKWKQTEFGELVKELEVVQAEKDTFKFNYHTIRIF